MKRIEVLGLQTLPKIQEGDELAEIVVRSADSEIGGLREKDIVVLTSKIVSKAQGRTRKIADVTPGKRALFISKKTGKDAKWLQMIFDEGHEILAILPIKGIIEQHILDASQDTEIGKGLCEYKQAVCITQSRDGRISTCDAGVDASNHPKGVVSLLPQDPDADAKRIRDQIQKLSGKKVVVILADTEMIPFGTMDFALGSSGIEPVSKLFGQKDIYDKPKFGGIDLVAHELTAASALVFGQTAGGIAAVIIRGYDYKISETQNISNTLLPKPGSADITKAIKAALRTTSYAYRWKKQLLLRIASWFV
jgi:coenzyme F420-0:L-glutamate ligase/coenzyme F420-1:gamma-L-glutamate ligase